MAKVVGSILKTSQSRNGADFVWRIERFPTGEVEMGECLRSPMFSFAGWELYLWLKRMDLSSFSSPVDLCLGSWTPTRCVSPTPAPFRYWLGMERMAGWKEEMIARGSKKPHDCYDVNHHWLPFRELQRRKECSVYPRTLSFIMRFRNGPEIDEMKSLLKEETVSGLEAKVEKFTQTDFKDMQINYPVTKKEEILNSMTRSAELTLTDSEDTNILIEQYRKYLLHADDHDVLFRVKDKEFKAHKSVLRVRSPVFEAMFKHDMKENLEDTITIEDVDPDCFCEFLMYIYTGKMENLSAASAMGLFYAGDKYDFPQLKRRCVDVLKVELSTSLVCNILTLAATHKEEELLESAMAYVTGHLEELMETTEWEQFLLSNPLQANKIGLRALKRRRTSDFKYEVLTNN